GNVFDEIKIARRTTAILRRTSSFTAEKPGVLCAGLGFADSLNDDPMFPVIAKIVDVIKLGHAQCEDSRKLGRCTILDVGSVGIGHAVFAVVNDEFPQMIVEPPHSRLN